MKTIFLKTILGGMLIAFFYSTSDAQMTLTGEVRPRTEYRHGYQSPLDTIQEWSLFTSQRTRLNFGYKTEKYLVDVSFQDVRIWGSQSQSVSSYNPALTFLHTSWGQYWLSDKLSVKLGRQEISYDDERLLGALGWAQQGRSHDAALLLWEDTAMKLKVHFGAAYNQDKESNVAIPYTVARSYKQLQYLWMNKNFGSFNASLLCVNNGSQSPVSANSARFFQTIGTHLEYKKGNLHASGNFFHQTGYDVSKKYIQSYLGGGEVNYTLSKSTVGIGGEYTTGQSQTDTAADYKKVNHVFNTLYPTGHKFNGTIDYFYAGSTHGNVGLCDIYLKTKYKGEKWWVGIDVHQFWAGAEVLDKKVLLATKTITAMNPNLGTEIDLTCQYSFTPMFSIQAGYSHYLPTPTLSVLKGVYDSTGDGYTSATNNWAFIMFIFKPNFLK